MFYVNSFQKCQILISDLRPRVNFVKESSIFASEFASIFASEKFLRQLFLLSHHELIQSRHHTRSYVYLLRHAMLRGKNKVRAMMEKKEKKDS